MEEAERLAFEEYKKKAKDCMAAITLSHLFLKEEISKEEFYSTIDDIFDGEDATPLSFFGVTLNFVRNLWAIGLSKEIDISTCFYPFLELSRSAPEQEKPQFSVLAELIYRYSIVYKDFPIEKPECFALISLASEISIVNLHSITVSLLFASVYLMTEIARKENKGVDDYMGEVFQEISLSFENS